MTRWWWGAALLVACGGAPAPEPEEAPVAAPEPQGPVAVEDDTEAVATVGPAGGTLSLTNGTRLVIPEGALEAPTEIRLEFSTTEGARAFADTELGSQAPLGNVLRIRPYVPAVRGAFEFSTRAQDIPERFEARDLTLAVEEESHAQRAEAMDAPMRTRWQYYPARELDGRFVAQLPVLHGHRLQFGVYR